MDLPRHRGVAGPNLQAIDLVAGFHQGFGPFAAQVGTVEDGHFASIGQVREQFQGLLPGLVQPAFAIDAVFHTRAGVEQQDDGDGTVGAEVEAVAEQFQPGQGQAHEHDEQDAHNKSNRWRSWRRRRVVRIFS